MKLPRTTAAAITIPFAAVLLAMLAACGGQPGHAAAAPAPSASTSAAAPSPTALPSQAATPGTPSAGAGI
jgi:hypothetical protein